MVPSTLLSFMYPSPPSFFMTAMAVIHPVSFLLTGLSEVGGVHLQYSKFWNVDTRKKEFPKVSGRTGMLVLYAPAFLAGVASLAFFQDAGLRFLLLRLALTVHFLKRVLEVLFIHKFSAKVAVDSMVVITLSYFLITVTMIYSLLLSQNLPEPSINLMYAGIVLFLIGIGGNFYHHLLLSKLRRKDDKEYKIPKSGLFDLVICPHYLFEIIDFIGLSFICQTLYSFSVALGTVFYLAGRSYATRRWYKSKFEDFPGDVKALVPFIF